MLQFFGLLGPFGLPAALLAILGFGFFGYLIMDAGRETKAVSHVAVLQRTTGRLSPAFDLIITFFLFGALSTMIAGAGSVLRQEYGIPWAFGAGLLCLATVATVLFGFRGVVTSISAIVPFLLGSVLFVSLAVLYARGPALRTPPATALPAVPSWPLAGVTYISYNIVMSIPVLASLGSSLRSRREAGWSAGLGAAGLGLSLLLVFAGIVSSFPDVAGYEVPMAYLASTVHPLGGPFYTLVFLAEVYTTAVANLYGFAARITREGSPAFRWAAVLAGLAGILAASAGFSTLVRVVYPLVGWAGLALLFALTIDYFRRRPTYRRRL
ncbi:MAG: hypothetical protein ACM3WU_08620 [Bacillota bacterium]